MSLACSGCGYMLLLWLAFLSVAAASRAYNYSTLAYVATRNRSAETTVSRDLSGITTTTADEMTSAAGRNVSGTATDSYNFGRTLGRDEGTLPEMMTIKENDEKTGDEISTPRMSSYPGTKVAHGPVSSESGNVTANVYYSDDVNEAASERMTPASGDTETIVTYANLISSIKVARSNADSSTAETSADLNYTSVGVSSFPTAAGELVSTPASVSSLSEVAFSLLLVSLLSTTYP